MKLAIFDVDGTLVDSQAIIVASLSSAFAAEGLEPPSRTEILSTVGLSLINAMVQLAPALAAHQHERMAEAYRQVRSDFRESGAHPENLYDGAQGALEALSTRQDILLGIATGKSKYGIDYLIDKHGWSGWFATIQTADDHPSKPHPSMVIQALAETGCEPREAIVIGDTSYDMEMARAAGAGAVGVTWGNHSEAVLRRAGAQIIVKDFKNLSDKIELIWRSGRID
jgi:phosphoglycolate phosphatase